MKWVGFCAWFAAAALPVAALHAETDAEYLHPGAPRPAAPAPAYRPPPFFAAGAAKTASRLPVEQRDDRAFIRRAAANMRFEAEAGKLALAKSANPAVRALAKELVSHQQSSSLELMHLHHVRGMALPMLDNDYRKVLKRLGRLGGTRFDHEFLEQVGLKRQREEIRQFEKTSSATRDPSLKGWVDAQLPALRGHLSKAEQAAPQDARLAAARARNRNTAVMGAGRPGSAAPVAARAATGSNTP